MQGLKINDIQAIWNMPHVYSNVVEMFRELHSRAVADIRWAESQGISVLAFHNIYISNCGDSDTARLIVQAFQDVNTQNPLSSLRKIIMVFPYKSDCDKFQVYWHQRQRRMKIKTLPKNLKLGDIVILHSPFDGYERAVVLAKPTTQNESIILCLSILGR